MGELARPPDAPFFPETPLALLTAREAVKDTWADKHLAPIFCGLVGMATYCAINFQLKRPLWAGIQNYFLSGIACYWIASKVQEARLEAKAERLAILKDYVALHPEDFPPYERKRIKDTFVPWFPVR